MARFDFGWRDRSQVVYSEYIIDLIRKSPRCSEVKAFVVLPVGLGNNRGEKECVTSCRCGKMREVGSEMFADVHARRQFLEKL